LRAGELEAAGLRGQLERLLGSPGFVRNARLSRFLEFVIARHMEGRDGELKESVLGVEVFGREPGYNPKNDPIVRTEAGAFERGSKSTTTVTVHAILW
jgi:hypothetical protein